MSSVLAVKLVSGLRRKPNPSGRVSRTPSANTCSPVLARFLMMANISSCLRMRPVFSISRSSACLRTSDTCSALSSFKCMDGLFGAAGGILGRGRVSRGRMNCCLQIRPWGDPGSASTVYAGRWSGRDYGRKNTRRPAQRGAWPSNGRNRWPQRACLLRTALPSGRPHRHSAIYFCPGWPGPSLSVRARPTSAPAPGGLSIFGRAKMNRFFVMVDADYLFRQAIDIFSNGASTSRTCLDIVDPAGLIEALLDKSRSTLDLTGKELLRVYWYDGVMANGFTPQQRSLAHIDDVQFRAGTINGRDQQKDIASLIATDLLELACHQAICDAVLVTGDSDLAVGIDMAKKRGVRIAVLGVEDLATGVARHRSAEIACRADRVGLLGQAELAQVLRYAPSGQSAPAQQSVAASGQAIDLIDRVRIEAAVKAFIDQQTVPLTGTVNHAAKRIDANVDRSLLFHVLTELGHGRLPESEKVYARHVFGAEVGTEGRRAGPGHADDLAASGQARLDRTALAGSGSGSGAMAFAARCARFFFHHQADRQAMAQGHRCGHRAKACGLGVTHLQHRPRMARKRRKCSIGERHHRNALRMRALDGRHRVGMERMETDGDENIARLPRLHLIWHHTSHAAQQPHDPATARKKIDQVGGDRPGAAQSQHMNRSRACQDLDGVAQRLRIDGVAQALQRFDGAFAQQPQHVVGRLRRGGTAAPGAHSLAIALGLRQQRIAEHRLHFGKPRVAERLGQSHEHRWLQAGGARQRLDGVDCRSVGMVDEMARRSLQTYRQAVETLGHEFLERIEGQGRGGGGHWKPPVQVAAPTRATTSRTIGSGLAKTGSPSGAVKGSTLCFCLPTTSTGRRIVQ